MGFFQKNNEVASYQAAFIKPTLADFGRLAIISFVVGGLAGAVFMALSHFATSLEADRLIQVYQAAVALLAMGLMTALLVTGLDSILFVVVAFGVGLAVLNLTQWPFAWIWLVTAVIATILSLLAFWVGRLRSRVAAIVLLLVVLIAWVWMIRA